MHKELVTYPHISSYSGLLLLGFFMGYLLARGRAKRNNIEGRHIDNLTLILIVICPAGARFFNRLFYYPTKLSFSEALKVWEGGGLVFYGGMIFGVVTVLIYASVMRVKLFSLGDVLAPSLALGLAFGRIGCFMAGCCWGDLCVAPAKLNSVSDSAMREQIQTFPKLCPAGFPLAVQFPPEAGAYEQHQKLGLISSKAEHSLPVHPIQLYESALVFGLCFLLNLCFKHRKQAGEILCTFGIGYGLIRFYIEFLRADSRAAYWNGMTISQVISLIIAGICLVIFLINRFVHKAAVTPLPIELEPAS